MQRWNYNLDITVLGPFLTKASEFGRLEFKAFIEVWFWKYGTTFLANGNLLRNAKCVRWRYQTQFKLKTANRRLKTKNSKLKQKTSYYATKLVLQSKLKIKIDLSKVTSENTRTTWADATQMYWLMYEQVIYRYQCQ